jgi:hypothetical protein
MQLQAGNIAYLTNDGSMSAFIYGDTSIRFKTSEHLERYIAVKNWDDGYIVVDAKYDFMPEPEEDYIDLVPILENLYMSPSKFFAPIKKVRVKYD